MAARVSLSGVLLAVSCLLRAVFVEEEPLGDVAKRFDMNYGTLRNWISNFRTARA